MDPTRPYRDCLKLLGASNKPKFTRAMPAYNKRPKLMLASARHFHNTCYATKRTGLERSAVRLGGAKRNFGADAQPGAFGEWGKHSIFVSLCHDPFFNLSFEDM